MPGARRCLRRVPLFADLSRRGGGEDRAPLQRAPLRRGRDGGQGGLRRRRLLPDRLRRGGRVRERQGPRTLEPGDYFGEIALIDEGARTATITATSDLVCWGLTFWDFRPLVEANAAIGWKLLQSLAKKLRAAQEAD